MGNACAMIRMSAKAPPSTKNYGARREGHDLREHKTGALLDIVQPVAYYNQTIGTAIQIAVRMG